MILLINSVDDKPYVALVNSSGLATTVFLTGIGVKKSENLASAVKKLLQKNKVKGSEILGVGVVRGPGSFSGSRAGVAAANALGYAWSCPAVGIIAKKPVSPKVFFEKVRSKLTPKSGSKKPIIVVPFYDRKPNITVR